MTVHGIPKVINTRHSKPKKLSSLFIVIGIYNFGFKNNGFVLEILTIYAHASKDLFTKLFETHFCLFNLSILRVKKIKRIHAEIAQKINAKFMW